MRHPTEQHLLFSNACKMVHNEIILKAIDDLNSQEAANVKITAKK